MRLDSDFIKGMPALSKEFWSGGLKAGRYFTEIGYNNQVEKLKEKVMSLNSATLYLTLFISA